MVEAFFGVVLEVQLGCEVVAGPFAQPGVGFGTAQAHLVAEFLSQGGEFRILRFVEGKQLVVVAPEHAVEGVVVGRRNGVVFVIVATGAGDGEAQGAAGDDVDAVVDDVVGDAEEAAAAGDEPQGGEVGGIGRNQLVSGELKQEESVVGQVGVEGVDDPVTVGGCVDEAGFFASVDVALGVGVAGDVEPMASPAFAVPGGVEQAVDESVGRTGAVAGGVGDEAVNVGGFGGKAGEIKAEASDEGARVGRRGGVDSGGFEPVEDEAVDGILCRSGAASVGDRDGTHGLKGPMVAGVVGRPDGSVDCGVVGAEGQHDREGPHDGGDACKELGQDSGDHFRQSTRSGSDASWVKAGGRGDRVSFGYVAVLRVRPWG